jgi:hypothetical protein
MSTIGVMHERRLEDGHHSRRYLKDSSLVRVADSMEEGSMAGDASPRCYKSVCVRLGRPGEKPDTR